MGLILAWFRFRIPCWRKGVCAFAFQPQVHRNHTLVCKQTCQVDNSFPSPIKSPWSCWFWSLSYSRYIDPISSYSRDSGEAERAALDSCGTQDGAPTWSKMQEDGAMLYDSRDMFSLTGPERTQKRAGLIAVCELCCQKEGLCLSRVERWKIQLYYMLPFQALSSHWKFTAVMWLLNSRIL